tara:strand:- start:84 stop:449 length:366 start_codon:yes stop_codon:yes gene_type:complete
MSQHSSGSVSYGIPAGAFDLDWSFIEPNIEGDEWFGPGIFDINMPIHPTYKRWLNPVLKVGDLVETYNGEVGIIVEMREAEGIALRINDANNNSYKVLIGDTEDVYIGYSLRKIKKDVDKD